jgi:predicted DsbA family dithiol-disulfide isomerase
MNIELIEYTDPYCTWCWGSEPILRRIQESYGGQVRLRFKMGGLVEDIRSFHDLINGIGGVNWYQQVAEHWLDASKRHGMPVDEGVWYKVRDEFRSTYPASIAYKAAELQGGSLARKFLRRMREGASAEGEAIHRIEVQKKLAGEVGLDPDKLAEDIKSGGAENAFYEDLLECRTRGITGFPTFLIRDNSGREVLLRGYQPFENFEEAFRKLAGNDLQPRTIQAGESSILSFVRKHGKVAPKEVAEVFSLTLESAMDQLEQLKEKRLLKRQKAGNGFFYLARNPMACNAETGICSIL